MEGLLFDESLDIWEVPVTRYVGSSRRSGKMPMAWYLAGWWSAAEKILRDRA
jgi:hypothetical protein